MSALNRVAACWGLGAARTRDARPRGLHCPAWAHWRPSATSAELESAPLATGFSDVAAQVPRPRELQNISPFKQYGLLLAPHLLIAAFIIYLVIRVFTAPLLVVVTADTYGYLKPALDELAGVGFTHMHGRPFFYPVFVSAVLRISGNLTSLILVQVLLIFGTYAALLVLLLSVRPEREKGTLFSPVLWIMFTILFFSFSPTTEFSQWVAPETLYLFVGVSSLLLFLFGYRLYPRHQTWAAILYSTGLFLSCINAFVKPQWLLWAMLSAMLWIAMLLKLPLAKRIKAAVALTTSALILVCLVVPEHYLADRFDPLASRIFGPKTLFCNHADIFIKAVDSNEHMLSDLEPAFASELVRQVRANIDGVRGWPLLGFYGDACMYSTQLVTLVDAQLHANPEKERELFLKLFLRSVWAKPIDYARKVLRQLREITTNPFAGATYSYSVTDISAEEICRIEPSCNSVFPSRERMTGYMMGWLEEYARPLFVIGTNILDDVNSYIAPTIFLIFVLCVIIAWWFQLRSTQSLQFGLALTFGAWSAQALLVAVSHTFDVGKYAHLMAPFLLVSLMLAVSLLWTTLIGLSSRTISSQGLLQFKRLITPVAGVAFVTAILFELYRSFGGTLYAYGVRLRLLIAGFVVILIVSGVIWAGINWRRSRNMRGLASLAFLAVPLTLVVVCVARSSIRINFNPDQIQADAYVFDVSRDLPFPYLFEGDGVERVVGSPMRLFESGVELGSAHTAPRIDP